MSKHYNVLFLCTGNSARSIMAEAIMNFKGRPKFTAYSAGSHPSGAVRPEALRQLETAHIPTAGLRSKSWDEFAQPDAPRTPPRTGEYVRVHPRGFPYAQLQKIYGAPSGEEARRYSPAKCIGCDMKVVSGDPDPKHVSTSYVERSNLTLRMGMRRFMRLTNGFSKKVENHRHMIAVFFLYYNFCRVHSTLRVTPAMEAEISDHIWSIEELCALLPKAMSATQRSEKNLVQEALAH